MQSNSNNSRWWHPQQGDSIQGKLINKSTQKDQFNAIKGRYEVETDNGTILFSGTKLLDHHMKYVNAGETVRITYEGKALSKKENGHSYHLYRVQKLVDVVPQVTLPTMVVNEDGKLSETQ